MDDLAGSIDDVVFAWRSGPFRLVEKRLHRFEQF
jgi:hypothetical protein